MNKNSYFHMVMKHWCIVFGEEIILIGKGD